MRLNGAAMLATWLGALKINYVRSSTVRYERNLLIIE